MGMVGWQILSHFDLQPPVRNDAHYVVAKPMGDSFVGVKCTGMRTTFRTALGAVSLLKAIAKIRPEFEMQILKIEGKSMTPVSLPDVECRYMPPYADLGSW